MFNKLTAPWYDTKWELIKSSKCRYSCVLSWFHGKVNTTERTKIKPAVLAKNQNIESLSTIKQQNIFYKMKTRLFKFTPMSSSAIDIDDIKHLKLF